LAKEAKVYEALKTLQGIIIPNIYAYGVIENRVGNFLPFLAMELIGGTTLDKAVSSMPDEQVPGAIKALMSAYKKLHAQDYRQRSVKALNVMLRPDGRAMVIDFGRGKKGVKGRKLTGCYREEVWNEKDDVKQMLKKLLSSRMEISYEAAAHLLSQYTEELRRDEARPALSLDMTTPRYGYKCCTRVCNRKQEGRAESSTEKESPASRTKSRQCVQHEARDFTAKQALPYILDLASKQSPFNMPAYLGPRKLATASKKMYLRMFGSCNAQILR
jgi:serine/threonine protein kinase